MMNLKDNDAMVYNGHLLFYSQAGTLLIGGRH